MLDNTYIHISGIGSTIEQRIWRCGIRNWEELLENHSMIKMVKNRKRLLLSGVVESIERLASGSHIYFAKRLAPSHQWRAYRHFRDKTAYVDIETTGLSPSYSKITVIGIYNGKETKTYIRGINLQEAPAELAKYKQLVTFNGARFDLPFIEHEFPGFFNHLHIDLMYPLKKLGFCGGLKNIERSLGLERSEETAGITGLDAVRLWKRHERGNDEALEVLIKYNREDVENLEKLIGMTYPKMIEREMKGYH
ncbi:MAG: ribonuclease H-like domain-containing protein [Candidatus Methanoperedens sp.]|nr:ribonuclease H-like domain-containing protein [Candidatus Methanoperedens sp.]MCZ7395099.1 ribonuclease H-like domain-containing protein [Candidatus Methanoperedens sp.]